MEVITLAKLKKDKFYLVQEDILPEAIKKTIKVKEILKLGEAKTINEAVERMDLSRSAYYKYKDYVFLPAQGMSERKAVISLMLHHDKGILSEVLNTMSSVNANILTINQNIPIHEWASVVLSFDLCEMAVSIDELLERLRSCRGVSNLRLIAVE